MGRDFGLKSICVLMFIILLVSACTIPFFFESPSMFYKFGTARLLLLCGKILGILTGVLLVTQPIFISRISFLDQIFSQQRLYKYHKMNAIVLTVFALLHPVCILWADDFSFFPMETRYWPEFLGMGLLCLICLTTLISFFRTHIRMGWKTWQFTHRIMTPLILVLFFIHVSNVSQPFESGLPNRVLIFTAFFTACIFMRKWARNASLLK